MLYFLLRDRNKEKRMFEWIALVGLIYFIGHKIASNKRLNDMAEKKKDFVKETQGAPPGLI